MPAGWLHMSCTLRSWECSSGYFWKEEQRNEEAYFSELKVKISLLIQKQQRHKKHQSQVNSNANLNQCQVRTYRTLPVGEVALVPFMSGEGVAFPPHVGFDLASKLVRHAAARSLHRTGRVERNQKQAREGRIVPRGRMERRATGETSLSPAFCCFI